jgi:hypothetical protein
VRRTTTAADLRPGAFGTAAMRKDRPFADGSANGPYRPVADLPDQSCNGRNAPRAVQETTSAETDARVALDIAKSWPQDSSLRLRVRERPDSVVRDALGDVDQCRAKPNADEKGDIALDSSSIISTENDDRICLMQGTSGFYDAFTEKLDHPANRTLYSIDLTRGVVLAQWSLPDILKSVFTVDISTGNGFDATSCWAANGRYLYKFAANDPAPKRWLLSDGERGEIHRFKLVPEQNGVILDLDTGHGVSSIVWASLDFGDSTPSQLTGGGRGVEARPLQEGLTTQVSGTVDKIATNLGASRLAVSIEGGSLDSGIQKIILFDHGLKFLMDLPGSVGPFTELSVNDKGSVVRAYGIGADYESNLSLDARLKVAQDRLGMWRIADDHANVYEAATSEKDLTKSKKILEDWLLKHPLEPDLLLLMANREMFLSRSPDERRKSLYFYDLAISIDPYDPIAHYMRGKTLSTLGDQGKAVEDFDAAIRLPHTLPVVKVIAGFLGLNEGIAKLSEELK